VVAGRYRLDSHLGSGGMGTVWRGWDEVLRRQVAVKEVTIAPGLPDAEAELLRERYLREARATARLHHPAVVGVYDVIPEPGRVWIVMELVNARDLAAVLREDGPLEPTRVARIGLQLLDALDAAHAAGVLHRDVKPANVLIAEGRTVLTDFGVASVTGDSSLTRTGQLVGSPAYLAPERLTGGSVGPASDLWSLGCTLYAATEGKPPFLRPEQFAIIAAITVDPVPPARQAGLLTPVLYGLLEKDAAARWDSARTRSALLRVAAGEQVESSVGWGTPPPDLTGDRLEPEPATAAAGATVPSALEGATEHRGPTQRSGAAQPSGPARPLTLAAAGSEVEVDTSPTATPPAPPVRRPRRRRRLVGALGIVLVMALAAAGTALLLRENQRRSADSASPSPGPVSPTASAPPSFATEEFVHPTRGFRIRIPASWSYRDLEDSPTTRFNVLTGAGRTDTALINSTNNLYVYVHPADGKDALTLAKEEDRRWATFSLFKHYQNLKLSTASMGQHQGGSLLEFTADHTKLGPRHVLIFRVVVNNTSYEVSLNGPSDKFDAGMQVFDDAVDSLVIMAATPGLSPSAN
jgi:serine/threonine protein kinase